LASASLLLLTPASRSSNTSSAAVQLMRVGRNY
jgi:hypothetical protein